MNNFIFAMYQEQQRNDIIIRELKQTDAAAVSRQISIQIQSDGCQGPTEFTWP